MCNVCSEGAERAAAVPNAADRIQRDGARPLRQAEISILHARRAA